MAKIQLSRSEGEIRLKVEDKEAGMPAEKLDEVTSPGALGVGVWGYARKTAAAGAAPWTFTPTITAPQ